MRQLASAFVFAVMAVSSVAIAQNPPAGQAPSHTAEGSVYGGAGGGEAPNLGAGPSFQLVQTLPSYSTDPVMDGGDPMPGLKPGAIAFSSDGRTYLVPVFGYTEGDGQNWHHRGQVGRVFDLVTGKDSWFFNGWSLPDFKPEAVAYCPAKPDLVLLAGWSIEMGNFFQKERDNYLFVFDSAKHRVLAKYPNKHTVKADVDPQRVWCYASAALSPSGNYIASAGVDGRVIVGMATETKVLFRTEPLPVGTSCTFAPDETQLLVGRTDGQIAVFDTKAGAMRLLAEKHLGDVTALGFLDKDRFYSASLDGTVVVRKYPSGEAIKTLAIGVPVQSASVSADGKLLAVAAGDVQIWSMDSGSRIRKLVDMAKEGTGWSAFSVGFSPDGKWLAARGTPETVDGKPFTTDRIWSLKK